MPDEIAESTEASEVRPRAGLGNTLRESSQSLEMILGALEQGSGMINKFTESHIDKILDQRGDIVNKVHEDRKDKRWDNKFYFGIGILATLILIAGIGILAPQYLSETITGVLGVLGGLGGGYGIAKR